MTRTRFARTSAEAWPREHANPIEFYPSPRRTLARVVLCLAASGLLGFLLSRCIEV